MARRGGGFRPIPIGQIGQPRDVGADLARQGMDISGGIARQGPQPGGSGDVGADLARQGAMFGSEPPPPPTPPPGAGESYSPMGGIGESYSPMGGIGESYSPTNMARGGPARRRTGYQGGGGVDNPSDSSQRPMAGPGPGGGAMTPGSIDPRTGTVHVGGPPDPQAKAYMALAATGVEPDSLQSLRESYTGSAWPRPYAKGGPVRRVGYQGGGEVYGSTAPAWDFSGRNQQQQQPFQPPRFGADVQPSRFGAEQEMLMASGMGYAGGGAVVSLASDPERYGGRRLQKEQEDLTESEKIAQGFELSPDVKAAMGLGPSYFSRNYLANTARIANDPFAPERSREPYSPYFYVNGGPVDDQDPYGMNTGYGQPEAPPPVEEPRPLRHVLDYIHKQFSPISEARADEAPRAPQMTGYSGGYGGDLTTSPAAPRNAREAQGDISNPELGINPPDRPPMSLQSPAPPSISGQDTPSLPAAPGASTLGRMGEQPTYDPNEGLLQKLGRLPGAIYDKYQRQQAEKEQYEGPSDIMGAPGRWWRAGERGIEDMIRGDRPMTAEQAVQRVKSTIHEDPRADHDKLVQDTYNNLGKEENGIDKQAAFVQAMRDPYNAHLATAQTALANNRIDEALFAFQQAHNLLPNSTKLTFAIDPQGGGVLATVQPHKGDAFTTRLGAAQVHDMITGHASHFDNVAKDGLEMPLRFYSGQRQVTAQDGSKQWVPAGQAATAAAGPRDAVTGVPVQRGPGGIPYAGSAPPLPRQPGTPEAAFDPSQGGLRRATVDGREIVYDPRGRGPAQGGLTERERGVVQRQGIVEGAVRDIQPTSPEDRVAAITGNLPTESITDPRKQFEAQDPRSVAAREQFVEKATIPMEEYQRRIAAGGQPTSSAIIPTVTPEGTLTGGYRPAPEGTTVTTPETARRQASLPAQHAYERQKLVEDYQQLQRAARETPNAPYVTTQWATQESGSTQRDPKTGMITHRASSSSQTPHPTLVQDPFGAAAEQRRAMTAREALQAYGPAPWERPGWHTDASQPLPPSVYARGPIQTGEGAAPSAIAPADMNRLLRNPNAAPQFDATYGQGAARRILGSQMPANLSPATGARPAAAAPQAQQQPQAAQQPPREAIQLLTRDPQGMRAYFDARYGRGAADRVLAQFRQLNAG
jgi:hypothetical protein